MNQMLMTHLRYNFYPSILPRFYPMIEKAIKLANEEKYDEEIVFPNGKTLTVQWIIEEFRLEMFLDDWEDEGDVI